MINRQRVPICQGSHCRCCCCCCCCLLVELDVSLSLLALSSAPGTLLLSVVLCGAVLSGSYAIIDISHQR